MPAEVLLTIGGAFVVAFVVTGFIRRFALSRGLLDVPNERSSHARPTPRGGGVATVIAMTVGLIALFSSGRLSLDVLIALGGGGSAVALVGWLDDRRGSSARLRLAVHFAAAAWALAWLGGLPGLQFGDQTFSFGAMGYVAGAVGIVWTVNLFNFMDGIDGIAASEAVYIASAAALITALAGGGSAAQEPTLVFAAACAGFLAWNWPPAKIFMGDVGSGYMGYVIAVLAIVAARENPVALLIWVILGGWFFVDATVTLVRRVAAGRPAHEPHRSHAYQRLAKRWNSHRRATVAVILVNLAWLLPCALLASIYRHLAGWMLAAALAPVILGVFIAGAGLPETRAK